MIKKNLTVALLLCCFGNTFSTQNKLDELSKFLEKLDIPGWAIYRRLCQYSNESLEECNEIRKSIPITYEDVYTLNNEIIKFENEYCGFTRPLFIPIYSYLTNVKDFRTALIECQKNHFNLDYNQKIRVFFVNPETGKKIYTATQDLINNARFIQTSLENYFDECIVNIEYGKSTEYALTYNNILTNQEISNDWLIKVTPKIDDPIFNCNEFQNLKIAFGGYVNTSGNVEVPFLPVMSLYLRESNAVQLTGYNKHDTLLNLAHERGHVYDCIYRKSSRTTKLVKVMVNENCTFLDNADLSEVVAVLFECNYLNYAMNNNMSLDYSEFLLFNRLNYITCDWLKKTSADKASLYPKKYNGLYVRTNLGISFAMNGKPFQENFDKLINDIDVFLESEKQYTVNTNEQDSTKYGIDNVNMLISFNVDNNIDYLMNVLKYISKK